MTSSLKMLIFLAPLVFLVACEQPENNQENMVTHILDIEKISLDEATFEQVGPFVVECHGNKLCVEICHRPPGNPENSHDKLLPLSATKAHLGHGDYLGSCSSEDNDPNGGGDESGDEGSDDDDAGPIDDDDDLPTWCEVYHDIDSDCDGYHDETGESLF